MDFVKQRRAFGQTVMDFQDTQFRLAECRTKETVARTFVDPGRLWHLEGKLDATTASMAGYGCTDTRCEIVDECDRLHGGAGYMSEYPIAQMYADARVPRIHGGTSEIMKVLVARSL